MFKAGDRVRCVSEDHWNARTTMPGDVLVVRNPKVSRWAFESTCGFCGYNRRFELITPERANVGDRIRVLEDNASCADVKAGDEFTVLCRYVDDSILTMWSNRQRSHWLSPKDYEIIERATPPQSVADPVTPPASDPVFRPAHYARYVIEPITFINANKLPANIANVVKYVCRYDAKNGREDLEKARRYIDIQLDCMARDERVAAGEAAADVWKEAL